VTVSDRWPDRRLDKFGRLTGAGRGPDTAPVPAQEQAVQPMAGSVPAGSPGPGSSGEGSEPADSDGQAAAQPYPSAGYAAQAYPAAADSAGYTADSPGYPAREYHARPYPVREYPARGYLPPATAEYDQQTAAAYARYARPDYAGQRTDASWAAPQEAPPPTAPPAAAAPPATAAPAAAPPMAAPAGAAAQSYAAQSYAAQPLAAQPSAAQSYPAQPSATPSFGAQPSAAQSYAAQSYAAPPFAAPPFAAPAASAQPYAAQSFAAQPPAPQPGVARLRASSSAAMAAEAAAQGTGARPASAPAAATPPAQQPGPEPFAEPLLRVLAGLALRDLTLVESLLELVEQLESREEDPQQLDSLFQVDHLATRMRRNSENLLVLAGQDRESQDFDPVPLLDVARAAVSEIAEYSRAQVAPLPGVRLLGVAADDVTHILAELLDNAMSKSPESADVVVRGERTGDGTLVLSVEDSGIGIPFDRLTEINTRLSRLPVVDVAVTRHMGLYVVGRLAHRHGIRVHLKERPYGGIVASVIIPPQLVRNDPDAPREIRAETTGRFQPMGSPAPQLSIEARGADGLRAQPRGALQHGTRHHEPENHEARHREPQDHRAQDQPTAHRGPENHGDTRHPGAAQPGHGYPREPYAAREAAAQEASAADTAFGEAADDLTDWEAADRDVATRPVTGIRGAEPGALAGVGWPVSANNERPVPAPAVGYQDAVPAPRFEPADPSELPKRKPGTLSAANGIPAPVVRGQDLPDAPAEKPAGQSEAERIRSELSEFQLGQRAARHDASLSADQGDQQGPFHAGIDAQPDDSESDGGGPDSTGDVSADAEENDEA
jgi:signal transduction histidine kinase